MPNYQKGKIYKLWSPQSEEIYIGSTTQSLAVRKAEHKSQKHTCCSKILFEKYDDVRIELIEEYPCKNKMELNKREGHHIRNNECVNKRIAGRTPKEWIEDNEEKVKDYKKEYYEENKELIIQKNKKWVEDNKEKVKEYKKKYEKENKEKLNERNSKIITCKCGCEITIGNLTRHKRSKKHIEFIQQRKQEQEESQEQEE